MEKRRFSFKEALVLVLGLAAVLAIYIYAKTRPNGAEAIIERDGEVYKRVTLAN